MSSSTRTRTSANAIRRHHRCSPLPSRHSAPETSRMSHTSSHSTSKNSSPQSARRSSGNLPRARTIIIFNSEASLGIPGEASLLKTDFAPLPSNRSGRERTGQEMPGACEADEKALGWASLHGNRQKRTCGCSEADGRGLLWASRKTTRRLRF